MTKRKRITIMLDDSLIKKLRAQQSKQINETQLTVSFSQVINDNLAKHYKMHNFVY